MTLVCSKCAQSIDVSDVSLSAVDCPNCGEQIELGGLRELTCPICCSPFGAEDSVVRCPDCKVFYHSECWKENHGCSTYGCASTQHLETHNAAAPEGGGKTVFCPFCGKPHASTDLACPNCGRLLQSIPAADNDVRMAPNSPTACSRSEPLNAAAPEGGGKTVFCPFCGKSHDSADMVCPNCGHMLQGAAGDGAALDPAQTEASEWLPRLGRNLMALLGDLKSVAILAKETFLRYADFKGKTARGAYLAYIGVLYVLTGMLFLMQADLVVYLVVFPVCAVPTAAATVRRLRDTAITPWLVFAIPLLPFLVLVPSIKEDSSPEVCE